MVIETRHFDKLEIDDDKSLIFEEGLPGFENCKKFVLLKDEKDIGTDNDGLFWYLQSIDDPDLAFVLMDVMMVMPSYNPLIDTSELDSLGEFTLESLYVYNVVVIPEDISKLSVNLKAPIVINENLRRGKQVVANNDDYDVRFYIFEELKKLEESRLEESVQV